MHFSRILDLLIINGPRREKTSLRGFWNNKGTDQLAFVIRLLESIISRPATSKISNFYLVSLAEETGFCLALVTPKTDFFLRRVPNNIDFFMPVNV